MSILWPYLHHRSDTCLARGSVSCSAAHLTSRPLLPTLPIWTFRHDLSQSHLTLSYSRSPPSGPRACPSSSPPPPAEGVAGERCPDARGEQLSNSRLPSLDDTLIPRHGHVGGEPVAIYTIRSLSSIAAARNTRHTEACAGGQASPDSRAGTMRAAWRGCHPRRPSEQNTHLPASTYGLGTRPTLVRRWRSPQQRDKPGSILIMECWVGDAAWLFLNCLGYVRGPCLSYSLLCQR